jgi:hypothetical protein
MPGQSDPTTRSRRPTVKTPSEQSAEPVTGATPILRRWSVAELIAAALIRSADEGPGH